MPIAMLVDNHNVSQDVYDQVREQIGLEGPAGGYVHIAGPSPSGGWRVIEVWDSEEDAQRFFKERLGPALQAVGAGPPPQPQFWPIHSLLGTVQQPATSGARSGAS